MDPVAATDPTTHPAAVTPPAKTPPKPAAETGQAAKADPHASNLLAGVAPGRIVHFVLPEPTSDGKVLSLGKRPHRAATITSDWSGPNQNLTVFLDQTTDLPQEQVDAGHFSHASCQKHSDFIARAWSVPFDPEGMPGTWHWPERA